jgi:hypothetical protein
MVTVTVHWRGIGTYDIAIVYYLTFQVRDISDRFGHIDIK